MVSAIVAVILEILAETEKHTGPDAEVWHEDGQSIFPSRNGNQKVFNIFNPRDPKKQPLEVVVNPGDNIAAVVAKGFADFREWGSRPG